MLRSRGSLRSFLRSLEVSIDLGLHRGSSSGRCVSGWVLNDELVGRLWGNGRVRAIRSDKSDIERCLRGFSHFLFLCNRISGRMWLDCRCGGRRGDGKLRLWVRLSWLRRLRTNSHELNTRPVRRCSRIVDPLFPIPNGIQYPVTNAFKHD